MAIQLNVDRLRAELAVRGVDQARFAEVAGVSAATVSHAMHGRKVSTSTLRAMGLALTTLPVMRGVAELLVTHATADATNSTRLQSPQEVPSAGARTAAE